MNIVRPAEAMEVETGFSDRTLAPSFFERALTPLLFVLVVTAFGLALAWSVKPVNDPYAELRSFDPKIGTRLTLPPRTPQGIEGRSWVLAYAGSCSSCSANSLDLKLLADSTRRQVLLVMTSPSHDWPASWRVPGVVVIQDQDNSLLQRLNALWTPRFYLIDKRARIEWISPKPGILREGRS